MFLTKSDQRLLEETDKNVQSEREATVRVLRNFLEIDRRRLYSALGKSSLKEFVMDRYQFSDDEAWRRVNAMRLLAEIPQLEKKIELGSLSLTHINLAQSLFKHERKNHQRVFTNQEKLEVLKQIENTSTREAQRLIFSLASSPMVKSQDRVRDIGEDRVEIKFSAPRVVAERLEMLKGFKAHSAPNMTLGELMDQMSLVCLQMWNSAQKPGRAGKKAKPNNEAKSKEAPKPQPTVCAVEKERDLEISAVDKNPDLEKIAAPRSGVAVTQAKPKSLPQPAKKTSPGNHSR